jgi:transcription elongation factor Elf1
MQITSGKIAARCPLCHHTSFQRLRDKHPELVALMMCNACGTETEYSALVAQLVQLRSYGREAACQ